jgi:hypothetical protein
LKVMALPLRAMSALCQKRTLSALFDHLVSKPLQLRRHVEAKRLGGPEIY